MVDAERAERLGLVLIGALFVGHVLAWDFVSDDAFITLRYSKNLGAGLGLVYNAGDRVEGFTTPLWTVLFGGVAALGIDPILPARLLGLAFGLGALVLVHRLFRALTPGTTGPERLLGLAPPLVLAANGSFACWAASGMETSLFVFLVVASVLALLRDRVLLSGIATSACFLTRPEGLIVFVVLAAFQSWRFLDDRRAARIGWLVGCTAALGTLLALRLAYYGEWLPNTYYAKTGGGLEQLRRGAGYFLEYAFNHEGVLLVVLPCAYQLLAGDAARRLVAVLTAALWAGVVWEGGDGLPMYRFALAPLPLLLVLQADVLRAAVAPLLRSSGWVPAGASALLAAAVALWAGVHAYRPVTGSQYEMYAYHQEVEVPTWIEVGEWFRDNAPDDASLALVPIGAVGYFSDLTVYDMLGLTDRHIARRDVPDLGSGWAGHEKHDGRYVLSHRPTYLLLGNVDVTPSPREPSEMPFIPPPTASVRARERDVYEAGLHDYRPRSVQLPSGGHLNFYEHR